MNFLELTLSQILFSYKGEIVRRQYALAVLVDYLMIFGGFLAAGYMSNKSKEFSVAIMVLVIILSTYSFTIIIIKRLRNIGAKWFWIFLTLVPYAGLIFMFVLMFIKPKDTSKEDAEREKILKIVKEGLSEEERHGLTTINSR